MTGAASGTGRSDSPRSRGQDRLWICLALLLAFAIYAALLTRGGFDLAGAEPLGLTYNSMLAHMLHGRWDVDPSAIGFEAFIHDGRAYAYFGPVPALLRLPLTLLPGWDGIHVERASCLAAILVGVGSQCRAVLFALPPEARRLAPGMAPILALACALGGPPLLLGLKGALIYHEAILWAWAFAVLFVAIALDGIGREGGPGARHLVGMSLCAGLCLLTRSTTGAGLVLAVGLFLLDGLVRMRASPSWSGWLRRSWSPILLLAAFLAATALVNEGRWHDPLRFADLRLQTIVLQYFPDRLSRLREYGMFNPRRIWLGAAYYLLPVWVAPLQAVLPLGSRIARLFDAAERPASSLLLTDPLWCLLAGYGLVLALRRQVTGRVLPLLAGLSLAGSVADADGVVPDVPLSRRVRAAAAGARLPRPPPPVLAGRPGTAGATAAVPAADRGRLDRKPGLCPRGFRSEPRCGCLRRVRSVAVSDGAALSGARAARNPRCGG